MIRRLRVVRCLLLFVVYLILVLFFAGFFKIQDKNSARLKVVSNETVDHDFGVKIVVFTPDPKLLFGNQLSRTLDRVNELNAETGENCEKRCEWTMDRNITSTADAVVFFFFSIGYKL